MYKRAAAVLVLAVLAVLFSGVGAAPAADDWLPDELTPPEIREERYYRIVDEKGEVIAVTGRRLYPGDEYLTADNRLFEIYRVEDRTGRARYRETVELPDPLRPAAVAPRPAGAEPRKVIAIYHTHNDESYIPTDGTESVYGRGGVHDVGDAFKEALEEKGINAIHSEEMHLPHDRGAYLRARETALELLEEEPDAVFDIHRDAAPPEVYSEEVEGEAVAQIQFVVGMQNPHMSVNRQFAYDLKGYSDRLYPQLVRGVLLSSGNYNQDLYPTNLLLEVGSHFVPRERAEEGIVMFSDVVAYYFYGPETIGENGGAAPAERSREAKGGGSVGWAVAGILAALAAGALSFYFLNNPGSFSRLVESAREALYREAQDFPRRLAEMRGAAVDAARQAGERVGRLRRRLKNR